MLEELLEEELLEAWLEEELFMLDELLGFWLELELGVRELLELGLWLELLLDAWLELLLGIAELEFGACELLLDVWLELELGLALELLLTVSELFEDGGWELELNAIELLETLELDELLMEELDWLELDCSIDELKLEEAGIELLFNALEELAFSEDDSLCSLEDSCSLVVELLSKEDDCSLELDKTLELLKYSSLLEKKLELRMTLPAQDESVNAPKIEKIRNSFLFFITMIINLFYK